MVLFLFVCLLFLLAMWPLNQYCFISHCLIAILTVATMKTSDISHDCYMGQETGILGEHLIVASKKKQQTNKLQ